MKEIYKPNFTTNCTISGTGSFSLDIKSKAKSLALCSTSDARTIIDYTTASKYNILPLSISRKKGFPEILLAVTSELDKSVKKDLKFIAGMNVYFSVVDSNIISLAIEKAYKGDDLYLGSSFNELGKISENLLPVITLEDLENTEPVPKALKTILEYAIAKEASDIHLMPSAEGLKLKLRIKGDLLVCNQEICSLPILSRLISRIKVLSKLRIDVKAIPQDGSFSIQMPSGKRQIRVSIMPTIHGEKCVLRITSKVLDFSLNNLGFTSLTLNIIKSVLKERSGLILVSGSTGSGKTTTLYSLIQELVKQNLNIVSIEDPVEAEIDGVCQTSLDIAKGLDYPTALKSILRQDPDVILIGEIRDIQSAELVLHASLSGHLVLSTIHASSAKDCITRLIEMGVNRQSLFSSLRLSINQSLEQGLCENCKVLDLEKSNLLNFKVYKLVGCSSCEYSGFSSRVLCPERVFLRNANECNQFLSEDAEFLRNYDNFEPKTIYLEKYLKEGIILPLR